MQDQTFRLLVIIRTQKRGLGVEGFGVEGFRGSFRVWDLGYREVGHWRLLGGSRDLVTSHFKDLEVPRPQLGS